MFLGSDGSAGEPIPSQDNQKLIFDVDTAEFEEQVIKASLQKPVVVQFWAPWCGPCKQLSPLLENAVNAAGGEVVMARVNLDENQELAQALQIQSVPTVFGFFQGRPVDAFQGLLPESKIKAFMDKIVQAARQEQPGAIDIPEALKAAAQALADGELGMAQGIYSQVLTQDEKNAAAYAGIIRTFIAADQLEQAAQLVEGAADEIAADSAFQEAKTALELAQVQPEGSLEELQKKLNKKPKDHQLRFDLANAQFAAGEKAEAIDNLLEIVKQNREWNDEEARKQLLKFFEALGPSDPLTVESRRKLSSILFS